MIEEFFEPTVAINYNYGEVVSYGTIEAIDETRFLVIVPTYNLVATGENVDAYNYPGFTEGGSEPTGGVGLAAYIVTVNPDMTLTRGNMYQLMWDRNPNEPYEWTVAQNDDHWVSCGVAMDGAAIVHFHGFHEEQQPDVYDPPWDQWNGEGNDWTNNAAVAVWWTPGTDQIVFAGNASGQHQLQENLGNIPGMLEDSRLYFHNTFNAGPNKVVTFDPGPDLTLAPVVFEMDWATRTFQWQRTQLTYGWQGSMLLSGFPYIGGVYSGEEDGHPVASYGINYNGLDYGTQVGTEFANASPIPGHPDYFLVGSTGQSAGSTLSEQNPWRAGGSGNVWLIKIEGMTARVLDRIAPCDDYHFFVVGLSETRAIYYSENGDDPGYGPETIGFFGELSIDLGSGTLTHARGWGALPDGHHHSADNCAMIVGQLPDGEYHYEEFRSVGIGTYNGSLVHVNECRFILNETYEGLAVLSAPGSLPLLVPGRYGWIDPTYAEEFDVTTDIEVKVATSNQT